MPDQLSRTLVYVTDPMCSWCWGFSPVIEAVRVKYQNQFTMKLLVGGLRPGNTERFDEHRRNYILSHWRAVHDRTGQPFNFSFQMGPDFTYDTEPAARAVVAVRRMADYQEFEYLKHVQEAFYVKNRDVTKETVLAELAQHQDLDQDQFLGLFRNADLKKSVWNEFDEVRQLGVSGFPALLGRYGKEITQLTQGYQSFDMLVPIIEAWLKSVASC